MRISNKTYDNLKWIALIGLPAVTTFYGVVGTTCGIPYTQETLTILTAFDVMLGTMLGISTKNYNRSDDIPYDNSGDKKETEE